MAILASAAVNVAALAALHGAGALRPPGHVAAVALAPVGAAEWERRRRVSAEEAHPAPAPRPLPRPSAPPAGRIVRVAPSPDPRRPERARFLSERDNTVVRETQRPSAARRDVALAARSTAGKGRAEGVPLPGEEGPSDEATPGREGAEARIARARRTLAPAGDAASEAASPPAPGDGGARRAGRFDPRILPVSDRFTAVGGGAPSDERLPGVADGDATLVNTRAFRYAAFYQRVYDAIAGEWNPNGVWDAHDPQDRQLGRTPRTVLVNVVLDREGRLRNARIARSSGLDFFDRECLRAIEAAAPFPNPPSGLVGPDGLVVLRELGLLFEWGPEALLDRLLPGR